VTLSVTGGTLALADTTGITFINSTANDTNLLNFQGTIGNLNSALNGLLYTPSQDFGGAVTLIASINDLGNTGSGGPQTASGSVSINVNPVAHSPSVTNASTLLNTQTTDGLVITPGVLDGSAQGYYQVAGITGGMLYLHDGTTAIANGQFIAFAQGLAGLKFTPSLNSTAAGNFTVQAASTASVSGLVGSPVTATIAVDGPIINFPGVQTIPEDTALALSSSSGNAISVSDASIGSGTVTVSLNTSSGSLTLASLAGITIANGGDGQSNINFTGTVAAVNAALDGLAIAFTSHFTGSADLGIAVNDVSNQFTATVPIGVTPVAHTPSVTNAITNEDQMTTSGLVITPNPLDVALEPYFQITNITGGSLFLNDGITPIANGDFITTAQGLAGLKFTPALHSSSPGGFDVQTSLVSAASGLGGAVVAATISVIPPSAPVNSVPAAQTVGYSMPLVFSSAAGNGITVSNSDGGVQQITLTVTDGTLTLGTTTGLTLISGTGTGDTGITFTALPAQIDAALDGLVFTPASHYSGTAMIQISSTDAQSIALGNPLSAMSSVAITVSAPPTPVLLVDSGLTIAAGSTAMITSSSLDAVEMGVSPDQLVFTVTKLPSSGRLELAGQPLSVGGTFTQSQIDQGQLQFVSISATATDDAFSFVVKDAAGTSLPAASFAVHSVAVAPPPTPLPPTVPTPFTPPPTLPGGGTGSGGSSNLVPVIQNSPISTDQSSTAADNSDASITAGLTTITNLELVTVPVDTPQASPAQQAAAAPAPAVPPKSNAVPAHVNVTDAAPPPAPAAQANPPAAQPVAPVFSGNPAATLSHSSPLWHDLDIMQQQANSEHETRVHIVAGTATVVSVGMSVVYLVWAIRVGSILSSFLSSMPAWKLVDPLPILDQASEKIEGDEEDEESLESMVDESRRMAA